jgi:hypothetical protein
MTEGNAELGGILARLEAVEKENRNLKRAGLVAALLVGLLLIMGQARPPRTVEAEKFVLKDEGGNSRAELAMVSGSPALTLTDGQGLPLVALVGLDQPFLTLSRGGRKEQVTLSLNKEFYGLVLYDEKKQRAGFAVWKGIPSFSLYDEKGTERARIDVQQIGPRFRMVDAESKAGFNMRVAPLGAGPDFSMYDSKGNLRVDVVAPPGGPSMKLADENGFSTIIGSTDLLTLRTGRKESTSAASLVLFGKDGKVVWSAP